MTPAAPRAYTRMCVRVCVRKAVHFCTLHPLNTKAQSKPLYCVRKPPLCVRKPQLQGSPSAATISPTWAGV